LDEGGHDDWIVAYYFGVVAEGFGLAVWGAINHKRAIRREHRLMHFNKTMTRRLLCFLSRRIECGEGWKNW